MVSSHFAVRSKVAKSLFKSLILPSFFFFFFGVELLRLGVAFGEAGILLTCSQLSAAS